MDKYESLKVSELRNIARFIGVRGWYNLKKRELIFLVMENDGYPLDRTGKWANKRVKSVLDRLLFPDTLRSWVELFVSDKSIAEHYVQVILCVLYPSFTYRRKRSVVPRKIELLSVK